MKKIYSTPDLGYVNLNLHFPVLQEPGVIGQSVGTDPALVQYGKGGGAFDMSDMDSEDTDGLTDWDNL